MGASAGGETEVLRQASAVLDRPVTLWEVTDAREATVRASSAAPLQPVPSFNLEATLRRWNVPIAVGSRWVAAPGAEPETWVVAPVRNRPPAPPPNGRERRSRERLALELAGLAIGSLESGGDREPLRALAHLPALISHEAGNPLAAARASLQVAMESVGRWVGLAADRRVALLDDLGQVIEDIDRATEVLRAVQERARGALLRAERFDAVRVVRSCLTLERRLLRDRGIDLEFVTGLEGTYLRGDPNALFDLLVSLVRGAADATIKNAPIEVTMGRRGRELEIAVRSQGALPGAPERPSVIKARGVVEGVFGGTVRVESPVGATTVTITLPLPPQREPGARG
ncbi:MAG: hypothetical protein ACREMN_10990 [Gemmatimonadales bacterium]